MLRRGEPRAPLGLLASALLITGCASGSPPGAPPQPSESGAAAAVAPVSYTAAQAALGREVFNTVCSACHALSEFRGQMFGVTWRARPVGDFLQYVATAMPQDNPGSLSPPQYASVVAYVLELNGHPAGAREVPADPSALAGVPWPR